MSPFCLSPLFFTTKFEHQVPRCSFVLGCPLPYYFQMWLLHHCAERSSCLDMKVTPDTTVYPELQTKAIKKCTSSVYVAVSMLHLICKMQVKCFLGEIAAAVAVPRTRLAKKDMATAQYYYSKLLKWIKELGIPCYSQWCCQSALDTLSEWKVKNCHSFPEALTSILSMNANHFRMFFTLKVSQPSFYW